MPQQLTPLPGQFSRPGMGPTITPPIQSQSTPIDSAKQFENAQYDIWLHDSTTQRVINSLERLCAAQLKQAGRLALHPGATQDEIRITLMKAATLEIIIDRVVKNEFGKLL